MCPPDLSALSPPGNCRLTIKHSLQSLSCGFEFRSVFLYPIYLRSLSLLADGFKLPSILPCPRPEFSSLHFSSLVLRRQLILSLLIFSLLIMPTVRVFLLCFLPTPYQARAAGVLPTHLIAKQCFSFSLLDSFFRSSRIPLFS